MWRWLGYRLSFSQAYRNDGGNRRFACGGESDCHSDVAGHFDPVLGGDQDQGDEDLPFRISEEFCVA